MSWQLGQRIIAEATRATVRGSSIAGGAQLHIDGETSDTTETPR